MTKYNIITLDENDIKEIIAEKFSCDLCNVEIEVNYGDSQYPQTEVEVYIFLN